MKKSFIVLALLNCGVSFSQFKTKLLESSSIFGGVGFTSYNKLNVSSFDISTYQITGLNSVNPTNNEGRLLMNIDKNLSMSFPNIHLGYDLNLYTPIHVQSEFSMSLNDKTNCTQLTFGGSYEFNYKKKKKLTFSLIGQVAFTTGSVYLGKTDSISGYDASFEIESKTFKADQEIKSEVKGTSYLLSLRPTYKINKRLSVYMEGGFRYSQLKKSTFTIGEYSFSSTQDYFVESGSNVTNLSNLPKLIFQAPFIQFGLIWKIKEFVPRDH